MKTILSILNELAATSSTNEKVEILKREKDNVVLKSVFKAAYDSSITYGIKQIPEYKPLRLGTVETLSWGISQLDALSSRAKTGNDAVAWLSSVLDMIASDDAIVLERIIQRDLRVGCSDTLAARVWVDLIPQHEVMLCSKDTSGITYPALAEVKYDGMRCHLTLFGGRAIAISRNGKEIELHGVLDTDLALIITEGETIDGELLVLDESGNIAERKVGNGILNKGVKGTISKEEADRVIFMAWDKIDTTSTIPYKDRIDSLTASAKNARRDPTYKVKIIIAEYVIVQDEAAAQEFYLACRKKKLEGAIIKNINNVWEGKRVRSQGKLKAVEVSDLIVVDMIEGTGKYIGMLGALVCETSDGLLQVNVGTGFSDEERRCLFDNSIIGRIVEIAYNEKITSKSKGTASLFLPRFIGVREDKDVANTIGELV
jgi:hypothetical protein